VPGRGLRRVIKRQVRQLYSEPKTVSIISGGNIDLSRVSQITGFVDA
jgi:threonine dehydratase